MKARDVIDWYLNKYKIEYQSNQNDVDIYKRKISDISGNILNFENQKKILEFLTNVFLMIMITLVFSGVFLIWPFGIDAFKAVTIILSLISAGISGVSDFGAKKLHQKINDLKIIRKELLNKKNNNTLSKDELDILKQKIDNLKCTKLFFQQNHQDELLDTLSISDSELCCCLENNISLLSILFLKHKNLITDNFGLRIDKVSLEKFKTEVCNKIDDSLKSNPSIFFVSNIDEKKEDTDNNKDIISTSVVSSSNRENTSQDVSRRRRYKG